MMQTVSYVEHLFCRVQTHPICFPLVWNVEFISRYDFFCIYIKYAMFISKGKFVEHCLLLLVECFMEEIQEKDKPLYLPNLSRKKVFNSFTQGIS